MAETLPLVIVRRSRSVVDLEYKRQHIAGNKVQPIEPQQNRIPHVKPGIFCFVNSFQDSALLSLLYVYMSVICSS